MHTVYARMRELGITEDIAIDAEDTDVVVLSASAAHKINGSLGLKRHGSIYNYKKLCTEEVAEVIIPLHACSGADATSSFFWSWKEGDM